MQNAFIKEQNAIVNFGGEYPPYNLFKIYTICLFFSRRKNRNWQTLKSKIAQPTLLI